MDQFECDLISGGFLSGGGLSFDYHGRQAVCIRALCISGDRDWTRGIILSYVYSRRVREAPTRSMPGCIYLDVRQQRNDLLPKDCMYL